MATKPAAWQEQGPVKSLNNESWAQGEMSATTSHNYPLQAKKAPRAEPEEDIDILEPEAQHEALQEKPTFKRNETVDGTKWENQKSTRTSLCNARETQEIVTELEQVFQRLSEASEPQEETGISIAQSQDIFPPPPTFSDLSIEECLEKEAFSSLEGEVAEGISDADIISDPTEDLMSPDSQNSQEGPVAALLTECVGRMVESAFEEVKEDNMTAEENDTQLHFLPDGFSNSEAENNTSGAARYSPFDSYNSDDVNTVCSPLFADESEEEEEMNMGVTCQQQWASTDINSNSSFSASFSVSPEQNQTSDLPTVSTTNQQEELLTQSQCELTLRGGDQEAAQQVHSQSSLPLSAVSIEVSNQGGAASPGCVCIAALRETYSRAGDSTEVESKQTGTEQGQEDRALEGNKGTGQESNKELLSYSETIQSQELKTEKYNCGVSFTHNRMESDSCDDSQSDSGVSADFSPCSTSEGNTTMSTGSPAAVPKETPIEREIRRAIEREHSLRRSRGLPNPPTSPEYVDIPLRKTVLCQSLPAKSEKYHGKDRQFAGKKMQHEIHKEAQREQDLVKLGKVPGFYDKGTVRQLKDRKQIFEAFQQSSDSTSSVSASSKVTSWASASDISTLENQEDISSQTSTIEGSYGERRRSIDLLSPTQSHSSVKGGGLTNVTPRGPGFSEATSCQVIILENNLSVPALKLCHAKQQPKPVTAVGSGNPYLSSSRTEGYDVMTSEKQEKEEDNEDKEEEEMSKENPFFKLRSSTNLVKVEQDIREAQEREKELRKQRISMYGSTRGASGGGGGGGGEVRPASMEGKSPTRSPDSLNGLAVPDLPGSSSRAGTGPSAARQSVGKLSMWPPAQAEEKKITRAEVLQSPRTPRQKTPLIHRWESGLVNGHEEND